MKEKLETLKKSAIDQISSLTVVPNANQYHFNVTAILDYKITETVRALIGRKVRLHESTYETWLSDKDTRW